MPCSSSAAVTLPVFAGSRPDDRIVYDGAVATFSITKAMAMIATVDTAMMPLERAGRARKVSTKGGMSQLHLGVEDVLGGLDGLRADLRGQLHRELCPLDRHHDGGRIGCLAGGERLRGTRSLGLAVSQRLQGLAEHVAKTGTGLRRCLCGIDRSDAPFRPAYSDGGINGKRHQRRRSSVRENICLADCIAVTFAS